MVIGRAVAWGGRVVAGCSDVKPHGCAVTGAGDRLSSSHLSFGKVDVGRCADVATDLGVDTRPTTRQLPSFLLFLGGRLAKRCPQRASAPGARVSWQPSRAAIMAEFDLLRLSAEGARPTDLQSMGSGAMGPQ